MPHDSNPQGGNRMTTRQQLHDIVDLAALLLALQGTRSTPAAGGRAAPAGVAHSPSPVRLDILHALDTRTRVTGDDAEDRSWHDRMASDHRQGLLPDLWQWARMIEAEAMDRCPELPAELPEQPCVASVVAWLLGHLTWALAQRWADELVSDIDWWWRRLRHLHGERDEYQPRCGRCLFPVLERDGGVWGCVGCGTETSLDAALKRLAEPVVTTTEAAAMLGVTDRTVRNWAKDLLPVNPGESRPRYLLRDFQRVAPAS